MRTWGGARWYSDEARLFLPREDVVALQRFAVLAACTMFGAGVLLVLALEALTR